MRLLPCEILPSIQTEVPNIYNYIDSKEAFLEYYLFNILNDFNSHMDDILESSLSPNEKLKYVISKHVQFTIKQPFQVALFVHDWRNLTGTRLDKFKEQREDYHLKVGGIVAQGIAKGQFRSMDIKIATYLIFSSLRWLFDILISDLEGRLNSIELEKQISDYVFKGLENK